MGRKKYYSQIANLLTEECGLPLRARFDIWSSQLRRWRFKI